MRYVLILMAMMCMLQADAQVIKVKHNEVRIDGVPVLRYKKNRGLLDFSLYSMQTNEELIYFTTRPLYYGGPFDVDDDYIVVTFLAEQIKTETTYTDPLSALTTQRIIAQFVKWLWDNGVINPDGSLHPENIQKFHYKYDQQISEGFLQPMSLAMPVPFGR